MEHTTRHATVENCQKVLQDMEKEDWKLISTVGYWQFRPEGNPSAPTINSVWLFFSRRKVNSFEKKIRGLFK